MARQLSTEATRACLITCGYDIEHKGRKARLSCIAPVSPNLVRRFISQHVPGVPKSG